MALNYSLINNNTEYEVSMGSNWEGDLIMLDSYNGKPITKIGYGAFTEANLTSVIISNNVTFIDKNAFNLCPNLSSVFIPDSVTFLGWGVFSESSNLKNVRLSNNLTNLPFATFADCHSLESIIIPKKINSLDDSVFAQCSNLTEIFFEGNAPYFGPYNFNFHNPNLKLYRKKNFVTGWPSSVQGVPVVLWSDNVIKGGGTGKLIAKGFGLPNEL